MDADACPVKPEIFRVAGRLGLDVTLAASSRMAIPQQPGVRLVVVQRGHLDAADDWIAEHVEKDDIVVTSDIPLAARCLEKGAAVLGPDGRVFDSESIGDDLATRALLSDLRETGTLTGGPAPFKPQDRSRFLHRLDETIQALRRRQR
ncbi:MAG: YaiI/YqxD family protein [Acidobacteriota bacterium]